MPGPDLQVRAETSVVAAPRLSLRPCPLETAACGLRGRAPPPCFPVPGFPPRPRAPSPLIHSTNSRAWGAEAGLGARFRPGWRPPRPAQSGRKAERSLRLPGEGVLEMLIGLDNLQARRDCPPPTPSWATLLCLPARADKAPSFSEGPPGWALVSSQGPETGCYLLEGTQPTPHPGPIVLLPHAESGT